MWTVLAGDDRVCGGFVSGLGCGVTSGPSAVLGTGLAIVVGSGFELAWRGGGRIDDVLHRIRSRRVEAGAGAFELVDLLGDDVDNALGFLQFPLDDQEGL